MLQHLHRLLCWKPRSLTLKKAGWLFSRIVVDKWGIFLRVLEWGASKQQSYPVVLGGSRHLRGKCSFGLLRFLT